MPATAFQTDEAQTLLPRCQKQKGNNTLFSLSKGTKKMHQLFKNRKLFLLFLKQISPEVEVAFEIRTPEASVAIPIT